MFCLILNTYQLHQYDIQIFYVNNNSYHWKLFEYVILTSACRYYILTLIITEYMTHTHKMSQTKLILLTLLGYLTPLELSHTFIHTQQYIRIMTTLNCHCSFATFSKNFKPLYSSPQRKKSISPNQRKLFPAAAKVTFWL